jgi:hypothetical protein
MSLVNPNNETEKKKFKGARLCDLCRERRATMSVLFTIATVAKRLRMQTSACAVFDL